MRDRERETGEAERQKKIKQRHSEASKIQREKMLETEALIELEKSRRKGGE